MNQIHFQIRKRMMKVAVGKQERFSDSSKDMGMDTRVFQTFEDNLLLNEKFVIILVSILTAWSNQGGNG